VLSTEELDKLARDTRFVQRRSKLCPVRFLDILIKDANSERCLSLLDYSNELQTSHGISVSAQGIDDRFNDYSVKFVKSIVMRLLSSQVPVPLDASFLERYTSVNILDSTKLALPDFLKDDFPGFGGSASESGISIQFRYDLKNSVVSSLDVYPATFSDSKYTENISVDGNSLEIFDLGYVSSEYLNRFENGNSHYVCRLYPKSKVYDLEGKEINLEKIYRFMRLYRIAVYDKQVQIGENRIKSRLILSLVDEQTYQKRLAKLKKDSRERGWNVSEQCKTRLHMNLMITNADAEEIPASKVYMVYKFRWQIELMFKEWKSSGWNLDKIKHVKYERYMCLLYVKLMMIILSDRIYGIIAMENYRQGRKILSKCKCVKTLYNTGLLGQMIDANADKIYKILENINRLFSRGHFLNKRKNRVNYADLFELFICKIK